MAAEMTVVIAYDVESARIRRRVAKRLQAQLARVQRSVFEGRLTRVAADRLYEDAEREIEEGDSLRMYVITASGLEHCRVAGGVALADASDCWLI
ncbi:MAG: CRISPR-associated endonuclease Cas2 [Hyphomicrobiales bacterium]